MVKAKQVELCPSCGAELPDEVPFRCPACARQLQAPDNPHFGTPVYLYFQRLDHKDRLQIESAKATDAQRKEYGEVLSALDQWARECPDDARIACFEDAYLILANLLHSTASLDTMRKMTSLAKKMGELAKAIEGFIGHGGKVYVGETRAAESRDNSGDQTPNY